MKSLIFVTLFAACFVLPYEMRVSGDTERYLYAAETLLDGMRYPPTDIPRLAYMFPPGGYYTAYPPLYPVLLAVGQSVFPPQLVFKLINLAGLSMIFWIVNRQSSHFFMVRVGLMCFVALGIEGFLTRALSDTLFLGLCFWFLDELRRGSNLWVLIPLAIAATMTRYVGVFLLITGIWVLFERRQWRQAAYFTVLALLPIGLWLIHNWVLTDTLMGVRVASIYAWDYTVVRYLQTIGRWIVQITLYTGVPYALTSLLYRVYHRHSLQRVYELSRSRQQQRWTAAGTAARTAGIGDTTPR